MDIGDAAAALGVDEAAVRQLVDEGRLAATETEDGLRFRPEDLDAFLESCRIRPGELDELDDLVDEDH